MVSDKVLERARALWALAERPGTPQEGEAASKKLAELLLKYNITKAALGAHPFSDESRTGSTARKGSTAGNGGYDGTYDRYGNFTKEPPQPSDNRQYRSDGSAWEPWEAQRTSSGWRVPNYDDSSPGSDFRVHVTGMPGMYAHVPKTFLRSQSSSIFVKMGGAWNVNESGFSSQELNMMEDFKFRGLQANLAQHQILTSFKFGAAIAKKPDELNEKPVWFKVEPADLRCLIGFDAVKQVRIASAMLRAAINARLGN